MTIETLSQPCWRLVHSNGLSYDNGDGTPHYDTEAKALARAAELRDYYADLTPKQYAEPCINVTCNGCGKTLDDGVWSNVHFETEREARMGAEVYDWVTELGPNVWHEECAPVDEDDAEDDDATLCAGCGQVIPDPDSSPGVRAIEHGGRICPRCAKSDATAVAR